MKNIYSPFGNLAERAKKSTFSAAVWSYFVGQTLACKLIAEHVC